VRGCAKAGCEQPAGATIGLRYGDRVVVMADLAPRLDPNLLELCERHADALTVPRGWVAEDRRSPVTPTTPGQPAGAL
jgi:Protein of unknown function (DUF3499)